MNVTTLGIDIAKNVFQIHGVDMHGKAVMKKRVSRKKLPEVMAQFPACLVGMEACSGSNYWARKFKEMGHEVKLISPQFVKPYVKSNKNDVHDAEAICEAVGRPNMRFVAAKNIEQQDIQAIHRIRSRLIKNRTAVVNQIRGLLAEYGIVIAQGITKVRKELPCILEDAENELSILGRELFADLYLELQEYDKQVAKYDLKIKQICRSNNVCKLLVKLPGVGPLIATAIVSAIGDAKIFRNGREMSAFLGVVPRQYSSGGKQNLLGISKRGDRYLRCLLIHGARAVLYRTKNLSKKKADWFTSLIERRGRNRAIVAFANKTARLIWAVMIKGEEFNMSTL